MTIYRRIEIVNGESAEPVAWVAVHPVNWPGYIGAPAAGFVEDEAAQRHLAAAERLREVAQFFASLVDAMDQFALLDELEDCGGDPDGVRFMQEQARAALADWTQASANESDANDAAK